MSSTASSRRELGRLAGNSAIYTAAALLTRGASFLLLPVYTRYLGAEGFGVVAVAGVITSVLGVLLPLSLHAAVARQYHDASDDEGRRRAVGTIWTTVVLLALAATVALDLGGEALLGHVFESVPFDPYLRLALWTACFTAIGVVPLQFLQTVERARAYAAVSAGGVLVTIVLVLLFVVTMGDGAAGYLRGTMIGAATTALAATIVVRPGIRVTLRRDVLRAALAFSLPLLPHTLAGWVLELSDRAILERFVSIAEVGIYSVGYQVGMLMSILASSANGALAPHLYAADARHGREAAATDMARIATYFCLVLGAAAAALAVLAVDIVRVFASPAFAAADGVARPVVLGQLAVGLYYLPANVLFIRARTRVIPIATTAAALLNIGLNLVFIPRYGIIGAAWTTTVAFVAMLALTALAAARVQRVPYEWRRLASIAAAVAVTTGAGWVASEVGGVGGVMLRVASVGLFPLVLWATGFVTRAERLAVRAMVARLRHRGLRAVMSTRGAHD